MSNQDGVNRFLLSVLMLYIATVATAVPYYNWEYARNNGFMRWAFFGEIVPSAKAVVWPYFAFRKKAESSSESEGAQLTAQQVSEMELKMALRAMNYSQHATHLLNTDPHERLGDYPNLREIVADRRKALEVGNSVDAGVLNKVFPELGDRFKDQFLQGVSLFVHGCETESNEELSRSRQLNGEWADWYTDHRKAIEDASNAAIGAQ